MNLVESEQQVLQPFKGSTPLSTQSLETIMKAVRARGRRMNACIV